ncbi:helix-turn-helix domain-containing protein [Paenibacillus sp. B2(2019)]|uniref:helix-turn-helix domain-containing protein n=1 Tax=Paenibacillus sp. B2(2019) TaxID=2607754 RepID=UPI0011F3A8D8|nr:helix-turn-helix transcriptional regulator [Paenibacillus sp. B2(2019)]KAA1186171.1 helix-turn-helix transcriptional regulator [Paenibacillus sp. B2(2019)]
MQEIGRQIRQIRNRKGISLNAYANELGVSPGYLSNLETGKTQNITLKVLEQLQSDLYLIPFPTDDNDELRMRLDRVYELLSALQNCKPDAVEYLLRCVEEGAEVFLTHYSTKSL